MLMKDEYAYKDEDTKMEKIHHPRAQDPVELHKFHAFIKPVSGNSYVLSAETEADFHKGLSALRDYEKIIRIVEGRVRSFQEKRVVELA